MSEPRYVDAPSGVREGQGFDVLRLAEYLKDSVPGLSGELAIEQFGRGFSNLTYLVRAKDREVVLRRAPPGVKIKSAHDMGREFLVLSKVCEVWPKVPRPLLLCEDEAVIGSPFYVMERVRGVILRARPPEGLALDEARMRAASESLVDTLAEIHTLDWAKAGLTSLGKPEGYVERQIKGWSDRYAKAATDDVPAMQSVLEWLRAHMPKEAGASLIHNDFKYDNVVLDAETATRVVAVLDWEMATIGDPLMDLGTTLGYWVEPSDPPVFQVMQFGPTALPGNLGRVALVKRYAEKTGRSVPDVLFYYVYALYKLAVVAQQLYRRYKDGLTKEERYALMLEGVRSVAAAAQFALEKGRIEMLGE
jgi:aminoglycoside phosphotransferase (APT) family kinase protein